MSQFETLDRARRFYRRHAAELASHPSSEWALDPYAWEFEGRLSMTPIEWALWEDIRLSNLVLYPQFPVGRFVVDFGNPAARVAIECDGRAYHQDKAKDAARQAELEDIGWTVYRFSGAECHQDTEEFYDEERGRDVVRISETRRRIQQIGRHHELEFINRGAGGFIDIQQALLEMVLATAIRSGVQL